MKCCGSDAKEEPAQPEAPEEPAQLVATAAVEKETAKASADPAPPVVESAPTSENVQDGPAPDAAAKPVEKSLKDDSTESKPASAPSGLPMQPQTRALPPQQPSYYYTSAPYSRSPYQQPVYAYPYSQPAHVQPPPGTVTRHVEPYVGPLTITAACLPGILCCFWCSLVFLCCPLDFTVVETHTVAAPGTAGPSHPSQAPQQQTYVYM